MCSLEVEWGGAEDLEALMECHLLIMFFVLGYVALCRSNHTRSAEEGLETLVIANEVAAASGTWAERS
jgi:hypothetical protein